MDIEDKLDDNWERMRTFFDDFVKGTNYDSPWLLQHYAEMLIPEIAGNLDVKMALLLMLISDDQEEIIIDKEQEKQKKPIKQIARGRMHIGLVGEPGTGKSVIMEGLQRDFDAEYLTQDTKKSSLKGDARRSDMGVQIFKRGHGGIICFDEVELMSDIDREGSLRDVMESGYVKIAKSGMENIYPAQIRILVGSNSFYKFSDALIDRLDFIFKFDIPSSEESKEIARRVTAIYAGQKWNEEISKIQNYVKWCREYQPVIKPEELEKINRYWDKYFDIGKGKTGRWIAKVLRVAFALAKLRHGDITVNDVDIATKMISINEKKQTKKEREEDELDG